MLFGKKGQTKTPKLNTSTQNIPTERDTTATFVESAYSTTNELSCGGKVLRSCSDVWVRKIFFFSK